MATFTRDLINPQIKEQIMEIAKQNFYLDGSGNVVTEENLDQAYLLVGKGGEITNQMVEKYGDFNKVAQDGAEAKPEADDETPSSNKSKETKTKGAK